MRCLACGARPPMPTSLTCAECHAREHSPAHAAWVIKTHAAINARFPRKDTREHREDHAEP